MQFFSECEVISRRLGDESKQGRLKVLEPNGKSITGVCMCKEDGEFADDLGNLGEYGSSTGGW